VEHKSEGGHGTKAAVRSLRAGAYKFRNCSFKKDGWRERESPALSCENLKIVDLGKVHITNSAEAKAYLTV
jgi:hypothetical protein